MPPLKAAIFDLDGTLIDSRADLVDSVNAMLRRMGLAEHEDRIVLGFVGEGAERLIRRSLGPEHEQRYPEAKPIWWDEYGQRLLCKTHLYDGVLDLLHGPPTVRAVLTNKPGAFARQILRGLGVLGAFQAVIGGDEAPRKPSPDGLLRLCADLGIQPTEAVMVGDSTVDLATGKAAGVRTCAVSWGLGERTALLAADDLCDSPAQLSALLARLVNSAARGGLPWD